MEFVYKKSWKFYYIHVIIFYKYQYLINSKHFIFAYFSFSNIYSVFIFQGEIAAYCSASTSALHWIEYVSLIAVIFTVNHT